MWHNVCLKCVDYSKTLYSLHGLSVKCQGQNTSTLVKWLLKQMSLVCFEVHVDALYLTQCLPVQMPVMVYILDSKIKVKILLIFQYRF